MGVSAREAAKQLGLTHPALGKAARSGRITREPDGSYDVEKVRRQLAENSNAFMRRPTAAERARQALEPVTSPAAADTTSLAGLDTLAEAQRRREWIRVQKDELDLARRRGELAPIGEVNAWAAGMITRARDILMRIGPELKDRLAQQTNPHEVERVINGEVVRALNELAEFKPSAVE